MLLKGPITIQGYVLEMAARYGKQELEKEKAATEKFRRMIKKGFIKRRNVNVFFKYDFFEITDLGKKHYEYKMNETKEYSVKSSSLPYHNVANMGNIRSKY